MMKISSRLDRCLYRAAGFGEPSALMERVAYDFLKGIVQPK